MNVWTQQRRLTGRMEEAPNAKYVKSDERTEDRLSLGAD